MNSLSGEWEMVAAECLDAVVSGRATIEQCLEQHPDFSEALQPMLLIAVGLRQMPQTVQPSASFTRLAGASLQARLASSSRPPLPARTSPLQVRRTLWQQFSWHPVTSLPTAIAVGSLVLSLIGAGIVLAANLSRPGDPLYGLDRALEQASLALADDETRTQLELEMAQERLDEAGQLEQLGRQDDATQALNDYQALVDSLEASGPDADLTQALTNLEDQRQELQPGEPPADREKPNPPDNNDAGETEEDNPGDIPSVDSGDQPGDPSGLDAPGKSEDSQGDPQSFDAPGNWQDAPGQTGDTPSGSGNNNAGGNSDNSNAGGNSSNNAGGNSNNSGNGNGGGSNNGNEQGSNSDPPEASSAGAENGNGNGSQDNQSNNSGQNNQSDNSQNNNGQSNNQGNSSGQGNNNNNGGQNGNNSGQSGNAGGNSNGNGKNK